jgi:HAD superfamily hydrolase (TIGR01509 family)
MIRAIIFDLDGTLADTEPLHFAAFAKVLRTGGIELSRDEYFTRLIGYDDRDCFTILMAENGRSADPAAIAELIASKAAIYQGLIAERDVIYPGAAEFVRRCAERFPLAIATGTLRAEAAMILQRSGLRELFVDVVAAEDVAQGKPAPDVFVTALGRLGFILRSRPPIEPSQCLVIEDTAAGVRAARAAGMRVLALSQSAAQAELAEADMVRKSLAETDLDDVLRRLK